MVSMSVNLLSLRPLISFLMTSLLPLSPHLLSTSLPLLASPPPFWSLIMTSSRLPGPCSSLPLYLISRPTFGPGGANKSPFRYHLKPVRTILTFSKKSFLTLKVTFLLSSVSHGNGFCSTSLLPPTGDELVIRTTRYYKVLLRTPRYYKVLLHSTTQYYKVLLQYYSVPQSTTPVLQSITPYKVLFQYYSVLQSATPVLQSNTPYYKVLLQCYSVLQSTTPVLLSTTKYYTVLQSTTTITPFDSPTHGTPSRMRERTGVTLGLCQILCLPRIMILMVDPCLT